MYRIVSVVSLVVTLILLLEAVTLHSGIALGEAVVWLVISVMCACMEVGT